MAENCTCNTENSCFCKVPGTDIVIPGFKPCQSCPPPHVPSLNSPEQQFVDSKIANESYIRLGKKTLVGFFTLKNTYEIAVSYSFTSEETFDEIKATEKCRIEASQKIWDLYSFNIQEDKYRMDGNSIDTSDILQGILKPPKQIEEEQAIRETLSVNIKTAEGCKEEDYTKETFEALTAALTAAKEVYASYKSTTEDLTAKNTALVNALIGLVAAEA